jgi:hypothetical protein
MKTTVIILMLGLSALAGFGKNNAFFRFSRFR